MHFKNLPKKAQTLLISFFFYSTAYPIISVFISAFIWKNDNNILYLISFRIGQFLIVPLAFIIGGILLRVAKINLLYLIGAIFIAVSSVLIIFLKSKTIVDFLIERIPRSSAAGLLIRKNSSKLCFGVKNL